MTSLTPGLPYYVRVRAHNVLGFGAPAISQPSFQIPTYLPPGSPPPVRLVSSSATSITVGWSYPRINGGATVMGFELWMDEWAGGNPRLVFDGTDQPSVTSFTVDSATSFGVQAGKSYRFMVRAINYCIVANNQTACIGDFSDTSVFAARAPRVPLPPAMPYRSSASDVATPQITIRWFAPIDNGGSPITQYTVYFAAPNRYHPPLLCRICIPLFLHPFVTSADVSISSNVTLAHHIPSTSSHLSSPSSIDPQQHLRSQHCPGPHRPGHRAIHRHFRPRTHLYPRLPRSSLGGRCGLSLLYHRYQCPRKLRSVSRTSGSGRQPSRYEC